MRPHVGVSTHTKHLKLVLLLLCATPAFGQTTADPSAPTNAPSKFKSADDGSFDVSDFLAEKYGFLPIPFIVTEPAVGYGAGLGLMFLSRPLPNKPDGLGNPNISMIGGFGTENGSWGAVAGDIRHWRNDRIQTLVGAVFASANLDFHGVGDDASLHDHPASYNLEPKGATARVKYRFGNTRIWAGLNYGYFDTEISLEDLPTARRTPVVSKNTTVAGFSPSFNYDTRDNFFTPTRGNYLEASGGFFAPAFGGDEDFQRAGFVAMHYRPLGSKLFLGLRADGNASFGDEPFYLLPYISLRGAPVLRYQGEEVAQIDTELRWQFWKRLSLVGFIGTGAALNDFERVDNTQTIVTGGAGFRYEIARAYGLHVGLDFAVGPDNKAVYIQMGSSWARP